MSTPETFPSSPKRERRHTTPGIATTTSRPGQRRAYTASALIIASLERDILRGKLKAGQHLREDEIAARFGVSRIPVREALRTLEAQRVVTLHPNRGAVVSHVSDAEFVDIFDIRGVLEGLAAKRAVTNLSAIERETLVRLVQSMDGCQDDPVRWGQLNLRFHSILNRASKSQRLLSLIQNLRIATEQQLRIAVMLPGVRERGQMQHHQIVEALEHRDPDRAERLVRDHLRDSAAAIASYLEYESASNEPDSRSKGMPLSGTREPFLSTSASAHAPISEEVA